MASGLVGALRAAGIEVLRTASCIEALALVDVVAPQVVLVDARLAGSRALCRQLGAALPDDRSVLVLAADGVAPPLAGEPVAYDPADPAPLVRRAEALIAESNDLRAASPLTGLPGNAAIRLELERRFAEPGPVALAYVDIDGFKPFNDHYGFLRGDDLLRALATLLEREAGRRAGTFVGHIGGDDFVLVADPDAVEAMATAVAGGFAALAPSLYDPEDAERGCIDAEDRRGRRVRWPLLTLSVGVATTSDRALPDPLALVDAATEMKQVAKRRPGNAVAVDRRDDTAEQPRRLLPFRTVRRVAAAALAAVILSLPGTGIAAAGAAPGDPLWPVARLMEDARLAVAGDARAGVHADLAGDRLANLVSALGEGDEERAVLAAFEYVRHVAEARAGAGGMPRLEQHARLLSQLRANACTPTAPDDSCGAVAVALRAADWGAGTGAGPAGAGAAEQAAGGD